MTDTESTEPAPPQGTTVRDLALELHQPVSLTIAQASAYSAAVRLDPYQERVPWIGDWVLTPQAAQWIRRPLRDSEPPPTAGFTSYYGPTAWDDDAGKQWHRDCPDTDGSGHDGEVWFWKDGSETCLDCGQGPDPEPSPAQLPARGPCSVPGQPREAAQAASPDPEDVASLLIRQDMRNADPVESRGATDQKIMAWAVRTAGHQFDPHELWDYDLLTDDQHVHRCITHRHTGHNTRGPVRRGQ